MFKAFLKNTFRSLIVVVSLLVVGHQSYAQRYNFKNYDIEDGLIQSQAQRIFQDSEHNLWISTFGGISRFNGRDFTNFISSDGVAATATSMAQDGLGNMWFASRELNYFDGQKIQTVKKPERYGKGIFHHLVKAKDGTLWGAVGYEMFLVKDLRIHSVKLPWKVSVDALATDHDGNVYASFRHKGLYTLEGRTWRKIIAYAKPFDQLAVRNIIFDKIHKNTIYLQSFLDFLTVENGKISQYVNPKINEIDGAFLSVKQDESGSLWICSTAGLFNISPDTFRTFSSSNGFTDNAVNDVCLDNAGNIWVATEGSGIFRFNGDMYVKLDQTQGLPNEVIMSLAGNKSQGIWMGTFGGGLVNFKQNKFTYYQIPSEGPRAQSIFSLHIDREDALWVGTLKAGLWKYKNGRFTQTALSSSGPYLVNGIIGDYKGQVWVSSPEGCFFYENNQPVKIEDYKGSASSIAEIGKDSILLGSDAGVILIKNKKVDKSFKIPGTEGKNILSIKKVGQFILLATAIDGLYIMNSATRKVRNYRQEDGLYSNAVYSITSDNRNIWLGTGRGINKIRLNPSTMDMSILNDHRPIRLVVEANQNAALFDGSKIWIGTAKGAFVYDPLKTMKFTRPEVKIQSVRISQPGVDTVVKGAASVKSLDTGKSHELPYRQNNLVISYSGIYLSDQDALRYQYRLVGLADNFSIPVRNTTVNYLSIPEGSYTFEVKAVLENGMSSSVKRFSFVVVPPFYRTTVFRIFMLLLIVFLIFVTQYYLISRKEKRRLLIQSITREEKRKIREQTAEDFHDDMGNKLTRISILSDILASKIDPDKEEERKLVTQIKDTASALYNGTKDILWALDPKADNLYEILSHLYYFGTDLFSNTGIDFHFKEPDASYKKIRLPMEYSRNVTMIFKELLNNVLKHSDAKNAWLNVDVVDGNIKIEVSDDGKGFDTDKSHPGKGMINIRNRSARLKGDVTMVSEAGKNNTITTLKIKQPG
ncbi:MAG: two-component regulator propeller domain-containing protein [Bacteroidota bacterium]